LDSSDEKYIAQKAAPSPLAESIPFLLPDWHARFPTLYTLVREARNDALHQGAYARHLTTHAIDLSIILEDALMTEENSARDFMVRNPVCASLWEPISSIRRSMLVNSFSFLPVNIGDPESPQWKLVADYSIATYLRNNGAGNRKERLARKLGEVVDEGGIKWTASEPCKLGDPVDMLLNRSKGLPILVLGPKQELRGIITSFDLL
jgi:hypothetical protein